MGRHFSSENVQKCSVAHTDSFPIFNATIFSVASRYKSAVYHSVSFRDEVKFGVISPLTLCHLLVWCVIN